MLGRGLVVLLVEALLVEVDHDLLVGLEIGGKRRQRDQHGRGREKDPQHQCAISKGTRQDEITLPVAPPRPRKLSTWPRP